MFFNTLLNSQSFKKLHIKAKTVLKNTRAIKNVVCKNGRARGMFRFTVQTEQGDFQAELHITAKTEYF